MKLLHEFETEYKGEKITLGIRKPKRLEIDEIDMMFSQYQSECIKRGILTKNMLIKKYEDCGGTRSESDIEEYRSISKKIMEKELKLQKLDSSSESDKPQIEKLSKEIEDLYISIHEFELEEEELFSRTAEVIAKNKTILWILAVFSQKKNGENFEDIFKGLTYADKIDSFYQIEEDNNEFFNFLCRKIGFYITLWFSGRVKTKEDFERVDKLVD